jgi:hypothetical protein
MKVVNASKLNRKSGVRWGERGAPVLFPVDLLRPNGKLQIPPRRFAPVGVCDFFIFRYSLRPESSQEHLPTSIAGVLRLRAIKPFVCDRSAKRFAQDDGFVGGLEIQVVGYAENTKRSKKSQALGMTKEGAALSWESGRLPPRQPSNS